MTKKTFKAVRFDEHMSMQIDDLSRILNVNKSTVIRMLCLKSLKDLQDEQGFWKLPGAVDKRPAIEKGSIESSNEYPVEKCKKT